jgi:hypothetical protein
VPPREAVFATGANGPAGAPGATDGVAASWLAPGNAEGTWLNAGAAEAQPWGTDIAPSDAARPALAVTAASPNPDELKALAPEPRPGFKADPNIWNPLPKALVVVPIEFMAEPAEPSIDAAPTAPDIALVPDVAAVDDEPSVVKDDSGDVDEVDVVAVEATALGSAADVNGVDNAELSGVDTAEVSGVTVCTPVPAEVPAACVTAAASAVNPVGSVVSAGVVNDVNVDAAEEAPA